MALDSNNQMQIMLIDNDKHIRDSLSLFFRNEQMRFLIFKSAAEGFNALKFQEIDVVISDYFLPDMDGVSFLKKVKECNPAAARVLMATIISDELKAESNQAGIDFFLEKPLTISSLDAVILGLKNKYQPPDNHGMQNEP